MKYSLLMLAAILSLLSSCSIKPVSKTKNVSFSKNTNMLLDVYALRKSKTPRKILVFVYGGNWMHGKKSIYRFFGKGMARKGIVCVVLNYRLSPGANINDMATDVSEAVKWTQDNAASFKGDPNNIYISGHSAGGHLAAMMATDNSYFETLNMSNPIKGTVLIDAFGLDMYSYLKISKNPKDSIYIPTFTNNPANWKKYSPIYHLKNETPPFLMFVGGKTYPVIKQLNAEFYQEQKKHQPGLEVITVKRKKHVPMIFQFVNPGAKSYKHILSFMDVKKID